METVAVEALAIAVGGLVSPGTILIVLLLLATHRGLAKSIAFCVGYFSGYVGIGWTVLLAGQRLGLGGGAGAEPSSTGSWVSIGLGVLLITLGIQRWRTTAATGKPRWMEELDEAPPIRMVVLGAIVSVLNFKNVAIYLTAVTIIAEAALPFAQSARIVFGVAVFFCSTVVLPVVVYVLLRERATPWLRSMKGWLEANDHNVGLTIMAVFGTLFVIRGVVGLA